MSRFGEDTFGLFEFGEAYAAFPIEVTLSISERGDVTISKRDSNITQTKRTLALTISR